MNRRVPAPTNIIKMESQIAVDQLMKLLANLDANPSANARVTFDLSNLTDEEYIEFDRQMMAILAIRAKLRGRGYQVMVADTPFLTFA